MGRSAIRKHYVAQESFRNEEGKRFAPDFVLHLPDNKHLIIDSKVSLVAYDKAVRADNMAEINQAFDEHCRSLRTHIEGLSKKNYSALLGVKSPDFVLMFVPIEPAYIEAMKHLVGRQGLLGKVERFQQLSSKASQLVPQVELLTSDLDTAKLEVLVEKETEHDD